MKFFLLILAFAASAFGADDLMKRRTPEYDYDVPAAGEYELPVLQAATDGAVWRAPRFEPASFDEIEALYAHGTRTLADMRFLDPQMPRRLLPRLRRLFARATLEKEEVSILRGILARIDQVLRR